MSKKLVLMAVVVMAMASISFGVNAYTGFNSGEDAPAYTLGELNGQGSANGDWAGAWAKSSTSAPVGVFTVAGPGGDEGGADQYMHLPGQVTSSYGSINRPMDSWNVDFDLTFSIRADFAGVPANLTSTQGLFLQNTARNNTMLSLKWESAGFRINEGSWISMGNPLGTGEFKPLGNAGSTDWITMKITGDVVDDLGVTLVTPTFNVYWEKLDGTLGLVLTSTRYRGTSAGGSAAWIGQTVGSFGVSAPKMANAGTGGFFDYDKINIVPEPMTMTLLGLGGLGLIRRKR